MNTPSTEKPIAKFDLKNTTPVECEKCHCPTFFVEQTVLLRKVSAIVSPSGRAGFAPIPVQFSCAACGHVNEEFLPPELRTNPIVKSTFIAS